MGRLIDEEKVLEIIRNICSEELYKKLKKQINNIPTTFDVNKVINIIEKNGYSWNENIAPLTIQVDLVKAIILANIKKRGD